MMKRFLRPDSLLHQIVIFVVAFIAALLLQTGISTYYNRLAMTPIEANTNNIMVINRFLSSVERYLTTIQQYRWAYDDTEAFSERLRERRDESKEMLDAIHGTLDQVTEEQYLLVNALRAAFQAYSQDTDQILDDLQDGNVTEASVRYYQEMSPCGNYLLSYARQLLEQAIQDNHVEYQRQMNMSSILRALQAVSILLCIGVGGLLAKSVWALFDAVRALSGASREISQGNLDTPDLDERERNEAGDMARAFNEMKHSMKRQVALLEEKNRMEQALLRKENEALELQSLTERSQLQLLRTQMNPHFLFNTLNVILYTAQQEQAGKTHELLGALSRLLRYTLDSNAAQVTLAWEIHITDSFFSLYHARFGDRLRMRWEIAPELDPQTVIMPSFILQPLVENAFRHGIAPKEEGGLVRIVIEAEENVLHIQVTDDGLGMSPEALADLQEKLRCADIPSTHIGVYNVAARTRRLGPGYGLEFYSEEGNGSCVSLRLPLILEEEDYDAEDDDC